MLIIMLETGMLISLRAWRCQRERERKREMDRENDINNEIEMRSSKIRTEIFQYKNVNVLNTASDRIRVCRIINMAGFGSLIRGIYINFEV